MAKSAVSPLHQGGGTLANMGRKGKDGGGNRKSKRAIWSGGSAKGTRFPYSEGGISKAKAQEGWSPTQEETAAFEAELAAEQAEREAKLVEGR